MEKIEKNGNIAVVLHRKYGIGWSSENPTLKETLMFHPLIVEKVEKGLQHQITEKWLIANFGEEFGEVYTGCVEGLDVVYIPKGSFFRVMEYDGFESIDIFDINKYTQA